MNAIIRDTAIYELIVVCFAILATLSILCTDNTANVTIEASPKK